MAFSLSTSARTPHKTMSLSSFRITTPAMLARFAMSDINLTVKRVEDSHFDITSHDGKAVRIVEDGPIHPLVNGQPSDTRFTLFGAKVYLGRSNAL